MSQATTLNLNDLRIDFVRGPRYRTPLRGKKELIAKATGLGLGCSRVLDVTAGLMEDAWTLARLGMQVTSLEQNEKLFEKLKQALDEAQKELRTSEIASRITVLHGNSFEFLRRSESLKAQYDVIYMDPMFDDLGQSALPRKEMQILRSVDSLVVPTDEFLQEARQHEVRRVVLKRPLKAPLVQSDVRFQFKGTKIRFDYYESVQSPTSRST